MQMIFKVLLKRHKLHMNLVKKRTSNLFNYKLTEYGETETGARARRSIGGRHVVPLFPLCFLFLSSFLFHTLMCENVFFLFFFKCRYVLYVLSNKIERSYIAHSAIHSDSYHTCSHANRARRTRTTR